ncbi:MAG: hypothetical protein A2284_17180 [Deltaproteobacteria bacterium RIFOXYA12_FULL_61_11]|nr:MAG: hypothetical protein A2284_17180 [Deltaproteobacteria bacterium RIFOXYA12_FULL_61_11]
MDETRTTDNPTILIVEDDLLLALDLEDMLRAHGFHVVRDVVSGEEGIAAASNLAPHLILMDIRLRGGINGLAAARFIRQTSRVPIIFLTAYADEASKQAAEALEAEGFLIKPIREEILLSTIRSALNSAQTN